LGLPLHAKEILAITDHIRTSLGRRSGRFKPRLRDRAIYLRHILKFAEESVNILGISAFYHDSAACVIVDGQIIAAAQEERFTRKKHDAAFPKNAIEYCLNAAGKNLDQIEYVVFYDKPFFKIRTTS